MSPGRSTLGFIFFLIVMAAIIGFAVFFGRGLMEASAIDRILHAKNRKSVCLSQTGVVQLDRISGRPMVMIGHERYFLDHIQVPQENTFILVVPLNNGLTKWRMIDKAQKERISKVYAVELDGCSRLP